MYIFYINFEHLIFQNENTIHILNSSNEIQNFRNFSLGLNSCEERIIKATFKGPKIQNSDEKTLFVKFQVLKATTMTSVMYLQELKTKNTQVD